MDNARVNQYFEHQGVLSRTELEARAAISYEIYSKTINIEARTMVEMASRKYIPAALRYIKSLADTVNAVTSALYESEADNGREMLGECLELVGDARNALKKLEKNIVEASQITCEEKKARYFRDVIVRDMADLRTPIDSLEMIVDADLWPVPTYGELIFEV